MFSKPDPATNLKRFRVTLKTRLGESEEIEPTSGAVSTQTGDLCLQQEGATAVFGLDLNEGPCVVERVSKGETRTTVSSQPPARAPRRPRSARLHDDEASAPQMFDEALSE